MINFSVSSVSEICKYCVCRLFSAEGSPVTATGYQELSESLESSCDQSEDGPSHVSNEPGPSDTK